MSDERDFQIEQLSGAPPQPPRARVDEADGGAPAGSGAGGTEAGAAMAADARSRDYLDGFLAPPAPIGAGEIGGDLYERVVNSLKEIFDPEIPVNIYDLGLIYGVEISDGGHVAVTMTLTTPHCPVAESMPGEVELHVGAVQGVGMAEVNLVWDPPWDPQKMSDEAKLELGML